MNCIGYSLRNTARRFRAWFYGLDERARNAIGVIAIVALVAIAGAIENTAPSGMYY